MALIEEELAAFAALTQTDIDPEGGEDADDEETEKEDEGASE